MRALTLVAVATVALVLAVTPWAAAAGWRVIGGQASSGDFAVALAAGNASRPHALAVQVLASPNQGVSGNWAVVCSKGFGAGSKSGNFSGRTPLLRTLRLPMANPENCTASAAAQLSGSGSIRVQVLSR